MEISFIHLQILVHLHVNKTSFHMKGFTLGLALKQRRKQLGNHLLITTLDTVQYSTLYYLQIVFLFTMSL